MRGLRRKPAPISKVIWSSSHRFKQLSKCRSHNTDIKTLECLQFYRHFQNEKVSYFWGLWNTKFCSCNHVKSNPSGSILVSVGNNRDFRMFADCYFVLLWEVPTLPSREAGFYADTDNASLVYLNNGSPDPHNSWSLPSISIVHMMEFMTVGWGGCVAQGRGGIRSAKYNILRTKGYWDKSFCPPCSQSIKPCRMADLPYDMEWKTSSLVKWPTK